MRLDLGKAVLDRGVNLIVGTAGQALGSELTWEGSTARKNEQTHWFWGRRALGEGHST